MRNGLQYPVTLLKIARLSPSARSPDQVVGCAPELSSPVAPGTGDGELQELLGHTVVEPVDDLLWHNLPELGIVGQDFKGKSLVDDLADRHLRTVRQRDPRPVGETPVDDTHLLPE